MGRARVNDVRSIQLDLRSTILVIDDHVVLARAFGLILEGAGYAVHTAKDAEEGLQLLRSAHPSAIVVDLHAPGMDSRAFVGRLRAEPTVADIPVLFLSSRPTSRDVVDAFASGGDDFLPKPFRTPELAARIFGLLRRARIARATGNPGGWSGAR